MKDRAQQPCSIHSSHIRAARKCVGSGGYLRLLRIMWEGTNAKQDLKEQRKNETNEAYPNSSDERH
jgi:hypothetical protein